MKRKIIFENMHGWTLCGNRPANIYLSVKWVEVLESSQRISLPLPLLPCESWMFVKESPDEKKGKEKCMLGLALRNIMYISCLIYFIRWWNIVEKISNWLIFVPLKKATKFPVPPSLLLGFKTQLLLFIFPWKLLL